MATARTLLVRVHEPAQDRENPLLALLGGQQGWEEFQAEVEEGIAAGRYDSRDMPAVVEALRGWLSKPLDGKSVTGST